MKNRQLLKIHGLSAVCSLIMMLASCSSEEIVPNGTGTDADGEKNLTTFVAVGPEQTRTSMDYTGGDAPFYWEEGDKIYVKDDDGAWKVSNAVDAAHAHSASFKFKVSGKFNNSSTYKVFYPGKNGTNDQVTIPATQTQTAPNTTLHFGEAGDCGMADATGGGGVFNFTLDHQAAILVFQPYTANEILKKCYLTKVEVLSNDNITGTYAIAPGTGDLTGAGSSKQIVLTTKDPAPGSPNEKGFSLNTTSASVAANGAYLFIKPGVHTLKVRYWIKDYVSDVEGFITKNLSSFDYKKNTYYDMTAALDVPNYETTYCYWDAQENYWYGHEWNAPNPADRWQPVVTSIPIPHSAELFRPTTPPRAASTAYPGVGIRNDAVNLCKDCPNANEMVWYAEKGDPRWDADILWTSMGHLRKGGFWLKTKDRMARDHSTTITNIESAAPDGTDWCIPTFAGRITDQTYTSTTPPSASEKNDYFFLPGLGAGWESFTAGNFQIDGRGGTFWSSNASERTGADSSADTACRLGIFYDGSNTKISISTNNIRHGQIFCAWKFE